MRAHSLLTMPIFKYQFKNSRKRKPIGLRYATHAVGGQIGDCHKN